MKQGSVWQVNLDPTIGSEIKKSRPCLILNNDKIGKLPLKIVAPITDFKEHYALVPWMVALEPTKENGLSKKSAIEPEPSHIRCVHEPVRRIRRKGGGAASQ